MKIGEQTPPFPCHLQPIPYVFPFRPTPFLTLDGGEFSNFQRKRPNSSSS